MKNYFTIHKNKKPKRIYRKKFNHWNALMVVTGVMGAMQFANIQSHPIVKYTSVDLDIDDPFKGISDKITRMANTAVETAISMVKLMRQKQLYRFKTTGSYGKCKSLKTLIEYEKANGITKN